MGVNSKLCERNDKILGSIYARTSTVHSDRKYQVVNSTGKHTNAILSCHTLMKAGEKLSTKMKSVFSLKQCWSLQIQTQTRWRCYNFQRRSKTNSVLGNLAIRCVKISHYRATLQTWSLSLSVKTNNMWRTLLQIHDKTAEQLSHKQELKKKMILNCKVLVVPLRWCAVDTWPSCCQRTWMKLLVPTDDDVVSRWCAYVVFRPKKSGSRKRSVI